MLNVAPKPVESVRFRSELAAFGAFRCGVDNPLYRNSGPCSYHTFAFPRTATAIRHDSGAYFVGSPKTVSFYNSGQVYFREAIAPVDATDWYVVADDVLIDAIRAYDPSVDDRRDHPFPFAAGPVPSPVYVAQRDVFDRADLRSPLFVEERVLAVLDAVLAAAFRSRATESARTRDAVEAVKRIVAADPSRIVPLRELAAAVACSPFHLCRAFRQMTGETISSFRRDLRLRLALDRIRDARDLTILALDLGFTSHSHFTAAFRRQFGVTPSALRAIS